MRRRYTDEHRDIVQKRIELGHSPQQIAKSAPFEISRQTIENWCKRYGWEAQQTEDKPIISQHTLMVPSDLPAKQVEFLNYVAQGNTQKLAADFVGIHENTVHHWKKDERFAGILRAAKAATPVRALGTVVRAAEEDPKAAQWLLTNHPETRGEFGQSRDSQPGANIRIGFLIDRSD